MMKTTLKTTSQHRHQRKCGNQRGFTLVEIMVALTIGLLMMAGILQISLANKESSRLQRNMGFVQENIRTASQILTSDIRMAGLKTDITRDLSAPRLAAIEGAIVGGGSTNDQITIAYQSNTDCLGLDTPPEAPGQLRTAVNRYFTQNLRLMCEGNGNPGVPQPLLEGVEGLQILFGENTNGDGVTPNRYVSATQANMSRVVAVRIGMRFISREAVRPTVDTNQYALLDAAPFTPGANDRLLRRELTTTISLRNDAQL